MKIITDVSNTHISAVLRRRNLFVKIMFITSQPKKVHNLTHKFELNLFVRLCIIKTMQK